MNSLFFFIICTSPEIITFILLNLNYMEIFEDRWTYFTPSVVFIISHKMVNLIRMFNYPL